MRFLKRSAVHFRRWSGNPLVRKYGADTVWMGVARIGWIVSALTVGILAARKLGPYDFGILNYAVAFVGMFSVLVNLGIDSVIARELIAHRENRDRILGNFTAFKILLTGVMFLASAGCLYFCGVEERTSKICLIVLAGYLFYPFSTINVFFTAAVRNRLAAYSQLAVCAVYSLVRLAAVLFDWPLGGYAAAEAVQTGGFGLFLLYFYCRNIGSPFRWSFRWREVFALFLPAIPLSISAVFGNIYARTDLLMLNYYRGAESVGYYAIATRFTENLAIFCGMLAGIFSSAVFSSKLVSDAEYAKQIHRYYFLLFWSAVPAIPCAWLLGRIVIVVLYGEPFRPAADAFLVFVCTLPMTSLLGGFSWYAANENKLKTIAFVLCSGALTNVFLNFFLIPRYGMTGAAWSSVLSMPAGMTAALACTAFGRSAMKKIFRSVFTPPSLKLNR